MSNQRAALWVGGLLLAALVVAGIGQERAVSQSTTPITGWAWSSNIGWVSLTGDGYGLTSDAGNNISGYAWSGQIGWIRPAQSGDGCPGTGASRSSTNNSVTGWLKVVSASNGWDGCISLSGSGYGVQLAANPTYDAAYSAAWGGGVVGWLAFNVESAACVPPQPVCVDSDTSRQHDPLSLICGTVDVECDPYSCVSGTCNEPSGCITEDGGSCPAVEGLLETRVLSGNEVNLEWAITNATSCSLAAPNFSASGLPATVASYTPSPYPITQPTTFTLTCTTGVVGDPPYITQIRVGLIPEYQEL